MEPNENRMEPILPEETGAEPTPETAAPPEIGGAENPPETAKKQKPESGERVVVRMDAPPIFYALWVSITALLLSVAVLLTFHLTSTTDRKFYLQALEELMGDSSGQSTAARDSVNFRILENVLSENSFYADSLDAEAMLQAAFKAYVAASGDRYAAYYTEEEYLAMNIESSGQYVGIGVTVRQETRTVDGREEIFLRVESVEAGSPAAEADIRAGDDIVSVQVNGAWQTVTQLEYAGAVAGIRGEEGTSVWLQIRRDGETHTVSCLRKRLDNKSVTSEILAADPTVAVVRISEFRLNTPAQFRGEVEACLSAGATRFVFDVRDNPGGDLRSIRAVLSNFLEEGDLILAARDKDGKMSEQTETRCAVVSYEGDGADCSVTAAQIGQYKDLDFVVLCNEKTASAAEIFTATLRDYGLSKATVGKKTFGKGIMQSIFEIPLRGIKGYIKLTTYEYVTKSGYPDGESYHGVGILPDAEVDRLAGTESVAASALPWEDDIQLQTAVSKLTAIGE